MSERPEIADLLDELRWRGLLHQCTNEAALREHLASADPAAGGRRIYCGFDPTSDSLTIGNLVPISLLRLAQRAGHTPVVVMGGGTGLIGDPSGKSAERELQTPERVEANVRSQRRVFERLLRFDGPNAAIIRNNLDWLGKITLLEALRDVGKRFSVNAMIQKDSVRERLHNREQGISFTEFSYQVLQAYDFLWLRRHLGVTVQFGGSDQWGNIVGGCDLVRREGLDEAFGLTTPLLLKADGTKFGKTESGALWLTPERTSAYAFHQFWLNADDRDLERFFKTFSSRPRDEIAALLDQHAADPGARAAHRALAHELTVRLHGDAETAKAEAAARALFSGEVAALDRATLDEVFAGAPASDMDRSALAGEGAPLVDLLVRTGLAASKREAREFLANGAVSVNGEKAGPDDRLTESRLLHGSVALLRRGKKQWHVTRWA